MGTNGGDTGSAVGISLVYWRCSYKGESVSACMIERQVNGYQWR